MRLLTEPHRRYDPLSGEWVLVSADRTERPWQGSVEPASPTVRPPYDPTCYLCPGNARARDATNPVYSGTFAFDNDFAALRPDTATDRIEDGLLVAQGEPGTCRVLCYSPRHDLTMAGMAPSEVRGVIDLWATETSELGRRHRWVQIFENRGEAMGASNPHPHGQIWAATMLPRVAEREDANQREHYARTGRPLLADYVEQEAGGPRVVVENEEWLIVVPFWATWPFETMILPRHQAQRLADLSASARDFLADALVDLLNRQDQLFDVPFPYSLGWHQAPFAPDRSGDDAPGAPHWWLHGHVYPPLLRSATVRKFMVGYELLAESQRDTLPEDAAARLAGLPGASIAPRAGSAPRTGAAPTSQEPPV